MKKTESITFRCSIEVKNELEKIAKSEDRSLSYVINRILENSLLKTENPGI